MKNLLLTLIVLTFLLSCKKENNYENDSELCKVLAEMTESDQRIRNLPELKNGIERVKDSLWKIQNQIDKKNTELLIGITKKRGWVSKKELGCTEYISPVVIFRHSPKEFWEEIRPLIEKEYFEKRMTKGDYGFIDNHLKGRPPLDLNFFNGIEAEIKTE